MTYRVTAVFDDRAQAAQGIDRLHQNDFSSRELTVVARAEDQAALASKATAATANHHAVSWAGAALGAAVGGYLGLLSMVLIPALPLVVLGAAAVGGFSGNLAGLGVADHQVQDTERVLQQGGVLLTVEEQNRDRAELARKLLDETPARSVVFADTEA